MSTICILLKNTTYKSPIHHVEQIGLIQSLTITF